MSERLRRGSLAALCADMDERVDALNGFKGADMLIARTPQELKKASGQNQIIIHTPSVHDKDYNETFSVSTWEARTFTNIEIVDYEYITSATPPTGRNYGIELDHSAEADANPGDIEPVPFRGNVEQSGEGYYPRTGNMPTFINFDNGTDTYKGTVLTTGDSTLTVGNFWIWFNAFIKTTGGGSVPVPDASVDAMLASFVGTTITFTTTPFDIPQSVHTSGLNIAYGGNQPPATDTPIHIGIMMDRRICWFNDAVVHEAQSQLYDTDLPT